MPSRPSLIPTGADIPSIQSAEINCVQQKQRSHAKRMCQHQPTHPACERLNKTKQAIHTLGTGMTSTWSHYNKRDRHTHTKRG